MWEDFTTPVSQARSGLLFRDWLAQYVLVSSYERKAREYVGIAEVIDSRVSALRTTPQSPPHHAEGPFVMDGVHRALAGLLAIQEGASLLTIEEFLRERHVREEIEELDLVIHEHAASLIVYLLVHDLGKASTLCFDASAGSLGEAEGFAQHKYRARREATAAERLLYGKLFKSYHALHTTEPIERVCAGFFDAYEIHAHYPEHEKESVAMFVESFDRLCDHFRLRERERDLVRFAVREHIRTSLSIATQDGARAYELLLTRAHKAGFDADDAVDFLLAAVFLDQCVGSLPYSHGVFEPSVSLVLGFLKAEEEVAPHRRLARRARKEEQKERALRYALKEAGLDGTALFSLLQTPFGPERGRLASSVREAVLSGTFQIDHPTHTHEIEKRLKKAHALFTQGARNENIGA